MPDVLYYPDKIEPDGDNHFRFYKLINKRRFVAVIKVLNKSNEIYLQSQRLVSEKQWEKAFR
ncbi:hypothetical protein HYE60_03315 [Aggregatibacter actinomycetemcomitans]|nr:hypothetical protein [Aggregatibacter actinomycetemcomitans]MBN6074297.1 hypothetical protein [Aggregatibacter actinomycetemcomitans]